MPTRISYMRIGKPENGKRSQKHGPLDVIPPVQSGETIMANRRWVAAAKGKPDELLRLLGVNPDAILSNE